MAAKARSGGKTVRKTAKKAAPPQKRQKVAPSTEFSLYAPDVKEVYLAGDFNDWQPDDRHYKLRKYKGDIWKKKVGLKPGRYEYQFVVDGQWWCDPKNDNRVTNPYFTQNSVITVE